MAATAANRFAGKAALVTGAGSGIGRATALAFAAEGARVTVADIDAQAGERTVQTIRDAGGEAFFVRADASRDADVRAMVERTIERYGRLDIAHNNAGGGGRPQPLVEYDEAMFDALIALNLKSVFLCMKHEVAQMLAQGGGAIVNTASVAGLRGGYRRIAYSAAKHAVIGMTKTAALEFAATRIRVNAVCPGSIDTEAMKAQPENLRQRYREQQPGKRFGEPEEVAEAVLWLCSPRNSFVTGVALPVDGGLSAG